MPGATNPDAWARIRTWEPLREGILSPSPLTGLGYPRAARETPGGAKTFFSRAADPSLDPASLMASGDVVRNRSAMVAYFSKAFFDEVARRLNADPEWLKKASSLATKIVLTCVDRGRSFLIEAQNGVVSSQESTPDAPAEFKFEGTYDAWSALGKGEKDLQSLVLGGKIRFRGSMPRIMGLMGPLARISQVAQQVPKEF